MTVVFEVFQVFFGYLSSYATKKRNIFIFSIISTIFSILMFYSVGNMAAILPVLTTGIRYFVFIFKDKYKTEIPLILCLLMHLISMLISTKSAIDIVPSALVILGCLAFWYLDNEKLKTAIFLINIPWILYYLYFGLYITALNTAIQTALVGISYIRITSKKRKAVKDPVYIKS